MVEHGQGFHHKIALFFPRDPDPYYLSNLNLCLPAPASAPDGFFSHSSSAFNGSPLSSKAENASILDRADRFADPRQMLPAELPSRSPRNRSCWRRATLQSRGQHPRRLRLLGCKCGASERACSSNSLSSLAMVESAGLGNSVRDVRTLGWLARRAPGNPKRALFCKFLIGQPLLLSSYC